MVNTVWLYDGSRIYDAEAKEASKNRCLKCEGTGWVWVNDPREPKPQPMPCPNGCLKARRT